MLLMYRQYQRERERERERRGEREREYYWGNTPWPLTLLKERESTITQCLPLNNTKGGGAGEWPEGRKHATPMPCRKKERVLLGGPFGPGTLTRPHALERERERERVCVCVRVRACEPVYFSHSLQSAPQNGEP